MKTKEFDPRQMLTFYVQYWLGKKSHIRMSNHAKNQAEALEEARANLIVSSRPDYKMKIEGYSWRTRH